MYLEHEFPKMICRGKDKPTQHEISLTNGSQIMCYAAGLKGEGIRTFTVTDLVIDEAAPMAREVFVATMPMLSVTRGTLDISSTPRGRSGFFYDCSKREQDELRFRERQAKERQESIKPKPKPQLSEAGKKRAADRKAKFQTLTKARIKVGEAKKEEQSKLEVDLGREQGLKELEELVNEEREKVLKAERQRTGIDRKKDKKEIEVKGIEKKPGETNAEYRRRYIQHIDTLPRGVNPVQFRGL